MAIDRTSRWDVFSIVASGAALVGTLVALHLGASPHRWRPVVLFAALWSACATYGVLTSLAVRRRALGLRTFSAPVGGRLSCPIWILMQEFAAMLSLGAGLAFAVAAFGFPSVAVGVLVPIAGIGMLTTLPFVPVPRVDGLTFEPSGLRVHLPMGAQFFVPWTSVVDVIQSGPAHHRPVKLRVVDPRRTIASVSPDTPRNRGRVHMLLEMGEPRGEAVYIEPWTAGLDSDTLLRLLRAAIAPATALAN